MRDSPETLISENEYVPVVVGQETNNGATIVAKAISSPKYFTYRTYLGTRSTCGTRTE